MRRELVQNPAREYDLFLLRKVELALASMRVGRGPTNSEVEAHFAKRREQATGKR
jgi:hypothetical protein